MIISSEKQWRRDSSISSNINNATSKKTPQSIIPTRLSCIAISFIFTPIIWYHCAYLDTSISRQYTVYPATSFQNISACPNITVPKEMVPLTNITVPEQIMSLENEDIGISAKTESITAASSLHSVSSPVDILNELSDLTGGSSNKDIDCPGELVPVYDKVVTTHSNTTDHQLIPRILHLSFKSRCLPRDLVSHVEKWKNALPNYSMFFHDDDAVNRLIHGNEWSEFPNLRALMKCVQPGAMTIDVWRILVLYKYGGIYSDIDNVPSETFTNDLIDPDVSAFFFSDGVARPSQWFIATEAHHKMLYFSLLTIQQKIYEMEKIQSPNILSVTGPNAFKIGYEYFLSFHSPKQKNVFPRITRTFTGLLGKKVKKMGTSETKAYIIPTPDYHLIVPVRVFNATLRVTRRERIELESGSVHWTKARHGKRKDINRRGSCKNFITKS